MDGSEIVMPKEKANNPLLFEIFINEFVQVVTDLSMYAASEDAEQASIPLTFNGYLLDMDDEFLYLGETSVAVDKAVKRENIIFIQMLAEEDPLSQMLNDMKKRNNNDVN